MKKVLVLARQDHASVSKEVRDATLQSMDVADAEAVTTRASGDRSDAMPDRMSLQQRRTDVSESVGSHWLSLLVGALAALGRCLGSVL